MKIENDVNLIFVDRSINDKIGIPALIKNQNKETLLIEVRSENQGNLLCQIQELGQHKVVIEQHRTLNQCNSTSCSESLSNSTIEEIEEVLKDQGVIKVERLKIKENGQLQDTHRYVFTFDKPDLPASIKITDWHHELIHHFLPIPMRCVNCQCLGHTR